MKLMRSGLSLLSPGGARGKLGILIFHRVLPGPDELFPEDLDAARFDEVCGWLAAWFNVLPLDEAVDRMRSRSLPPRALCITFDDGYADNATVALPILRRHGLTATFFIAAGFIDGGVPWNDVVTESFRRCERDFVKLPRIAGIELGAWNLSGSAERRAAILSTIERIKYLPAAQRLDAVQAVVTACGVVTPRDRMMSSAQLKQLVDGGMSVGGHTISHPILAHVDEATVRREIAEGRDRLQAITGRAVELFAYPNGRPMVDFVPATVEVVRSLGFKAAVTTSWGFADAKTDCLQLPRFTPWDRTRWAFGLRLGANLCRRCQPLERPAP
jgi:peptidoglycan/xylan/chitin deacetylase (PgdA/CDA1 family)